MSAFDRCPCLPWLRTASGNRLLRWDGLVWIVSTTADDRFVVGYGSADEPLTWWPLRFESERRACAAVEYAITLDERNAEHDRQLRRRPAA